MTEQQNRICANCRYYVPLGETAGYCGNYQMSKPTKPAARACGFYEPRPTRNIKPDRSER